VVKRPIKPPSKPLLRETEPLLKGGRRRPRDPEQPSLPFDPMPYRIEPCLALLKPKAPTGSDWLYEIKWDGYRLQLNKSGTDVTIITRGGHDWTDRFPTIVEAAEALPVGTAILDGEAVVLDDAGRSDFGALQQALGGRSGKRHASEAIFIAFDCLYLDGHNLQSMEQDARRHLLEGLVPASADDGIRLSQEVEGDGPAIFAAACEHGLEGIIAKHKDEPYRSGRGGEWVKVKCIQSETFVVVGYEHSMSARAGIGALLLGAMKEGKLTYVGSVGTGFSERNAWPLREQLDKLVSKKPPVAYDGKRKNVVWVRPKLLAEIEFRAWTGDGKLRHASYKGLRDPKDNADIYEIVD
jgi:bifunctional non-homologous end joining protein LigD